jgi:hypothetical protein
MSDWIVLILNSLDPADRNVVLTTATEQNCYYLPYYERFKREMNKILTRLQLQE